MAKITITEEGAEVEDMSHVDGLRLLLGSYITLSDLYIKEHPASCKDCKGYNNTVRMRAIILKELDLEEFI